MLSGSASETSLGLGDVEVGKRDGIVGGVDVAILGVICQVDCAEMTRVIGAAPLFQTLENSGYLAG